MLYDDRVCKEVLSKSRVLPIFGATLPASNELISWTKKSDDIFFGFSNVPEVVFTRKKCLDAVTTVLHV